MRVNILAILCLLFFPNTNADSFDDWLDVYKDKEYGLYLVSVFDGVIAVPNVFHIASFMNDEIVFLGLGRNMENLGVINYAKSEDGQELDFPMQGESTGECYGLDFKTGDLDGEPMTMVSDGESVLFISSNMSYLPEIMFLPMEERLRAKDETASCHFLYDKYMKELRR